MFCTSIFGRLEQCRVLRDSFSQTPPGPEGSNGSELLSAQWVTRRFSFAVDLGCVVPEVVPGVFCQ